MLGARKRVGKRGDRQARLDEGVLPASPQGQRINLALRATAQRRLTGVTAESHANRDQRCRCDANRTGILRKDRLNNPVEHPTEQHKQKRKQTRLFRVPQALMPALKLKVLKHVSFARSSRTAGLNDACLLSFPLPRPYPHAASQACYGILCRRVSKRIITVSGWFRQCKFSHANHCRPHVLRLAMQSSA